MERMLLLYRDARSTDSEFNHVNVILDTVTLDWNTMHNTYGVPANASGDTTVTFVSYDSDTTGYRRCYFDSNHNVHSSYMPSNTVYFDESDGTFYIFPTGTTRNRTNPYVPFLNTAGEQIELHEFTYSSKRMGDTPQITANFYDYDCYDKKWNIDDSNGKKAQRYSNVFTIFNGERYYLKSTPTSVFENTDARYKHSLVFLSERDVFEHVLMFDTVPKMYSTFLTTMTYHSGDVVRYNGLYYKFIATHTGEWNYDDVEQITVFENALAESTQFSFYGNIIELAKRINASLVASEVSTFNSSNQTYEGYHIDLLVYDEFSTTKKYNIDDVVRYRASSSDDWGYYQFTQVHNAGAWNSSQVKTYELPETVITFDNNTLKEALGFIDSDFGLSYYFDQKVIYIRSYQSEIGSTSDPIVYGEDYEDALLSIHRNNKTQDVVNRMTALGSEDNIPYYYPNPTEEGWLEPRYNGQESAQLVAYTDTEAYLKNRMATAFVYGYQFGVYPTSFKNFLGVTVKSPQYGYISCTINGVSTQRRYVGVRFKQECDEPFRLYMTDSLFIWTGQSSINSSWKRNKYGGVRFDKNDSSDTTNYDTFYTATYIDINYVNANTGKYTADFFVIQYIETYYFNGNQSTSRIGFRQPQETINIKPWSRLNSTCDMVWYDRFYPLPPYKGVKHVMVASYLVTSDTITRDCELGFRTNGIDSAFGGYVSQEVEAVICDGETFEGNIGSGGEYYSNRQTALAYETNAYYVDISDGADGTDDVRHRVYRCGAANSVYDSKQGNKYTKGTNSWSRTFPSSSDPAYTSKFGNRVYNTNDIRQLFSLSEFKYNLPHWYLRADVVDLSAYGISYNGTPALLDQITFVQVRYLTPQSHLMPALYFKTNGDRRFYNATQYPIVVGTSGRTPDTDAGEEWNGSLHTEIVNKLYKNGDTNTYMMVENPYEVGKPHEHIEEFDDIKPTIKDVKVNNLRIDVIDRIEFDQYDNDELKQLSGDSSDILAYKHPYFYVKLRPLGFNLFDLAIDEAEMLVEFTTGSCGSCSFQIAVGEQFKENCVCIWEYNAYKYNGQLKYAVGDLMRYDNEQLYKDTGHAQEITGLGIATLPADGSRTWGDVKWKDVVRSNVAESQRDTTTNYVWIALKKDVDTFGTIMPTRINGLVPKSVNGDEDGNMTSGSVVIGTGDQDTADRLVLTHIRLPQAYVRAAEEKLSKELIRYMVEHNMEDFSFTIKFSRIYFAEHQTVQNTLNENSLIHIVYANHGIIDVLVSSFQYKVVGKDALPEISVELQDKLTQINWRTIKRNRIIIPNTWITPVVRKDVEAERWLARIASRVRLLNEESNTNGLSIAQLEERFHLNIEELSKLQSDSIKEIANADEKIVRLNSALGFSEFDETKEYQAGDYVIYKNRVYKFKTNHYGGSWMGSDEVDDSTNTDMIFKALGYKEFSESTSYSKDDIVYKNNRLVKFTAAKPAGGWDEEKVTSASIKIEDGISRNAANAADIKASNILTDLGFKLFDSTRSYSENEIVVYNNRLYRFTTSKSVGNWDVSKVALDSVANCVFRSLGLEEYNASSTQTIRRGTSFFKNGKALIATQDFVPSQVGMDISRVTNPYNVVAMTATESDTKALAQTVEVLRQTVSSLNSQILDKDNGLATIVRGVNSRLATLTYDMATLADSLKANEYLAQDESVTDAAAAVVISANAATTELTGADDSSVYNKMADIYSKDVFGERISVVRSQFTTEDAEFKFTKMVYNSSHYMTTQDDTFVEFSTEESYNVNDRVIYNKHLYEFTSAHEKGEWNPLEVTNIDDILLKAVFFATDKYNEDLEDIFLTKGRFIGTNAFCDYVYETVIKSGEAGILFTDLKDIVDEASKGYDDIYDNDGKNMITDHIWSVRGYTVLQFSSLRLEYNDRIYVAATYKDDYTRDDNRHILFDIKYINEMSEKLKKFFIESDKNVEYDGQMYYYMPRVDLAKNLGDNYLYCADAQVDDNNMLFVAELYVEGEPIENCYLLHKE